MKKIFYLMLVALTVGMFTACDDDDENTTQINNPEPKEQWGKTLRGDNQTLLAFPDIYADYWEYTYSYKDNPNIGLRLTGKFPKSRFFNFTVYNDETQIDVDSIDPRFAPGTGTRVCEGLMPDEFNNFVDHMLSTNLVKSMDLVELNPELDVNEQTTNLCLEIIDYITARL